MNTRLGLLGVLLLLLGSGLFAWAWSARSGSAPASETARPGPGGGAPVSQDEPVERVVPPAPTPEDEPVEEPVEVAAEPAGEAEPAPVVERPLLQQTASDWLLEYGEASRAELEREVESLRERFAEDSRVAFKLRMAEGQVEVVAADAPPVSDPDDPNGLIVSEEDAGDGKVQRIVLYPQDAPGLYALRTKLQWLEGRLATLGDG
jgi:hypothetical protein